MDNVQKFGEDVAVPKNPESEGSRLITLKQIEQEHGVSRSALHTYRRSASFPQPVPVEGSTKVQYRASEVDAWFQANPPQQGKRTDLAPQPDQGEPVTTTVDPRIAILSALNTPPYDDAAGVYATPLGEAAQLLDAYRASMLKDFLFRLEQSAGDAAAEKLLEENPELAELLRAEASDG